MAHNIIAFCLPSHSTHLVQPLDVGVFPQYQKAYGKLVDDFSRAGGTGIGKADFIKMIPDARRETFVDRIIRGGFKGAGLTPFNPLKVLEKLPNFNIKSHEEDLGKITKIPKIQTETTILQTPKCAADVTKFAAQIENDITTPMLPLFQKLCKVAEKSFAQQAILEEANATLQ